MDYKRLIKYFLDEAILVSDKDEIKIDSTEEKKDFKALLKKDFEKLLEKNDLGKTSLGFVFGNRKIKYKKKWGIIYNVTGNLNKSQKEAIRYALKSDLVCVEGPPGNGKSEMITGLIINAILRNKKVVVASYNNKAVDAVKEKIEKMGIDSLFIRTGNSSNKVEGINYFVEKINIKKCSFFLFLEIFFCYIFFLSCFS